ncbi:MAG: hypothetical protein QM757_45950 [Paludibaculum sp.]
MCGRHGPRTEEDALQVDANHGVEALFRHEAGHGSVLIFDELRIAEDPRIVDEDVDAAPQLDDSLHRFFHCHRIGDVDLLEDPIPAGRGLRHIPPGDAAAFLGEAFGRRAADTGRGSSNDHDLAL